MKVADPGHLYILDCLDTTIEKAVLRFVKREGENYPGNVGHHPGTTLQEVFRACIKRLQYVDKQVGHPGNERIIDHLRESIIELEKRAAERHNAELELWLDEDVENFPTEANGHWKWIEKDVKVDTEETK